MSINDENTENIKRDCIFHMYGTVGYSKVQCVVQWRKVEVSRAAECRTLGHSAGL